MPNPLSIDLLSEQLVTSGLGAGQAVIVHTAMSKLGWVSGGPVAVIQALLRVVGTTGTLMMPTQSWKNLDPARGVHNPAPEAWWPMIRATWPAYDPAITPSNGMGAVAELFRTWPGAVRSAHPARSFAALGPLADELTRDHKLEDALGETSPLGKLYIADGYILLLGVGHASNTSLHLAEHRANYPGKRMIDESSAVLVGGERYWATYPSLDVHSEDFSRLGDEYEAAHNIHLGRVGLATVHFLRMRPLVDWAVQWMERERGLEKGKTH